MCVCLSHLSESASRVPIGRTVALQVCVTFQVGQAIPRGPTWNALPLQIEGSLGGALQMSVPIGLSFPAVVRKVVVVDGSRLIDSWKFRFNRSSRLPLRPIFVQLSIFYLPVDVGHLMQEHASHFREAKLASFIFRFSIAARFHEFHC